MSLFKVPWGQKQKQHCSITLLLFQHPTSCVTNSTKSGCDLSSPHGLKLCCCITVAAARKHFWYKMSRNLFSRVRLSTRNTYQVSPEQTGVPDFERALSWCEYTTPPNSRKLRVNYWLAANHFKQVTAPSDSLLPELRSLATGTET